MWLCGAGFGFGLWPHSCHGAAGLSWELPGLVLARGWLSGPALPASCAGCWAEAPRALSVSFGTGPSLSAQAGRPTPSDPSHHGQPSCCCCTGSKPRGHDATLFQSIFTPGGARMKRISHSVGAEGTGCPDQRAAKQRPGFWGSARWATPFPVLHPDHGRPSPLTPAPRAVHTLRQLAVQVALLASAGTRPKRTERRGHLNSKSLFNKDCSFRFSQNPTGPS